tara:strand:+ start:923 stop:1141 length:219 start_codon:yes stop_codon:yes gene_type:complete
VGQSKEYEDTEMTWILMLITIEGSMFYMSIVDAFPTANSCMQERAEGVIRLGKPIINYQLICIPTDQLGENT